ncbi:snoRNA-associated small subunit rRNA processing protein, putative [Plasmodium sp. DRC-Itaito]|nr:snoRNA-associated small subunit rRNA processing protein, putative [Plasmodium sp. DRC-Itaito]
MTTSTFDVYSSQIKNEKNKNNNKVNHNKCSHVFSSKNEEVAYDKTRLIIKNIPKYMNEIDLKKHFFKMKDHNINFQITDIKIMKRKKIIKNKEHYESRRICFIGFLNNYHCECFKKFFNNTYINTSKIIIEDAISPSALKCNNIKYNNTHVQNFKNVPKDIQKTKKKQKEKEKEKENSIQIVKDQNCINKTVQVKKTKAGMNSTRNHVIYLDEDNPHMLPSVEGLQNDKSQKNKKKKKKKKKKKTNDITNDITNNITNDITNDITNNITNDITNDITNEDNNTQSDKNHTNDHKNDEHIIKCSELLLDDESNTHSNNEDNALQWLKEISKKEKKDKSSDMVETIKYDNIENIDKKDMTMHMDGKKNDTTYELDIQSEFEEMNTGKLIIFNLPPVDEQDIKSLCERYGPIVDINVIKKKSVKGDTHIYLNDKSETKSSDDFFIKLLKGNTTINHNNNNKNNDGNYNKKDDNNSFIINQNKDKQHNNNHKCNMNILYNDLTNVKVYALVKFMFPSSCEKAKIHLDNKIYGGKILTVKFAKEKKLTNYEENIEKFNEKNIFIKLSNDCKTSYKKILEIQKKKSCQNENMWNILYTDINTSINNFCKENNCSVESVLNIRDKNIAVNVSLTETYIINKIKAWIKKEGIYLDAFEQIYVKEKNENEKDITKMNSNNKNENLSKNNNTCNENNMDNKEIVKYRRSDDTIIIKNLSIYTNQNDIINLFKQYGILKRVSFSPYNNICIIQYENSDNAKKAFISNSYIRYKKLPLYLEWAPLNLFVKQKDIEDENNNTINDKRTSKREETNDDDVIKNIDQYDHKNDHDDNTYFNKNDDSQNIQNFHNSHGDDNDDDDEYEEGTHASIYIKNINFNTKEENLKSLFEKMEGFITCNIVKSKKVISQKDKESNKISNECNIVSSGYGFAEFKNKELAIDAIKRLTGTRLNDHLLEMSLSHNRIKKKQKNKKNNEDDVLVLKDKKQVTKKLVVKNLAFQVNKEELRKLFSAFGNVKSVRIPKNVYNRSRGYAFIEFMSKKECCNAIESLQHTHLYGRHLIIEFADDFIFDKNVDEYDKLKEINNEQNKDIITSEQAKRKSIYESQKSKQVTESKKRRLTSNLKSI